MPCYSNSTATPRSCAGSAGGSGTPLEIIRERIIPACLALPVERGFGCMCVFERASGEFLGWVSLRPGEAPRDGGELGYRFRRTAWGRGFATEAASALLARAFEEMGFPRVFATTYEANLGSQRVMEKLGMELARRFRPTAAELASHATYQPGNEDAWDGEDVEYAIERAAWLESRG